MPLTLRLGKKLTVVRLHGDLWCLRLDGQTQLEIEDVQRAN